MATLITQSIDVTKITKSKLREGKYLDITTIRSIGCDFFLMVTLSGSETISAI